MKVCDVHHRYNPFVVNSRRTRVQGLIAAAVLSGLTLTVFAAMRERGPETPIRRFHQALTNGDSSEAVRQMVQPVSDEEFGAIYGMAFQYLRATGGNFVLRRTVYQKSDAYCVVEYGDPARPMTLIWVATHTPRGWRLNPGLTLQRWRGI